MGDNHPALVDRLKDALALQSQAFSSFLAKLTPEEQQQIRQWVILAEELNGRGLSPAFKVSTRHIPNYNDPVDELRAAFSDLIFRAETRLTAYGKEQVFDQWANILTQRLNSRKQAVMLRWLIMAPTMSKNEFCKMIAKENEAFPPNERAGWTSTNADGIKRIVNEELQKLGAQEEPTKLSVIEGGRKAP